MARPLSALDSSFVYMERRGLPLHVAGLTIIDPARGDRKPVTLEELRLLIHSRLDRLPGFRLRLVGAPFGIGRPTWRDEEPNLIYHVRHHVLEAPGSEQALMRLCARIHEEPLRRDRPLWEAHLIDGLPHRRQALLIKMHHSIADGMAGMQVARELFDRLPGEHRSVPAVTGFATGAGGALKVLGGGLGLARLVAGGPLALPGPFTRLGRGVGPHRSLAVATLPVDQLRTAKERFGGSMADLLLGLIACSLGPFVTANFPRWHGSALRVMLPVSTRTPGSDPLPGSRVTAVFMDLPMRCTSLASCVPEIAAAKADLRGYHEAAGVAMLVSAPGILPAPIHSGIVQLVTSLPIAHLVISDIPGPLENLALLRAPIVASYPLMPLATFSGASIAAVSMAGNLGVGFTFDAGMVPDPAPIAREMERLLRREVAPPLVRGARRAHPVKPPVAGSSRGRRRPVPSPRRRTTARSPR